MAEPKIAKTDNESAGKLIWLEAALLRHRLLVNIVVHAVLFSLALMLGVVLGLIVFFRRKKWL